MNQQMSAPPRQLMREPGPRTTVADFAGVQINNARLGLKASVKRSDVLRTAGETDQ